jgi:N-acetylglutamate synthase-like GNAT family acetyltransferase
MKPPYQLELIHPGNKKEIDLIAAWYSQEWNIDPQVTRSRLQSIVSDKIPLQIIIKENDQALGTAGLYPAVSISEYDMRYKSLSPWLALVYVLPEKRNQGIGALLCEAIETSAKGLGIRKIYLFTFTAERLYQRLNWKQIDRLNYKSKDTVVMEKEI